MLMTRFQTLRILCAASVLLAVVPRAELTGKQAKFYNELRKRFFVAIAMPPSTDGKYRKEHLTYLRAATSFMKAVPEEDIQYRAGAFYFRGRVLLHAGRSAMAAKDFAASLEILEDRRGQDALPPGLTSITTVHVFRALSLVAEDDEAALDALEAVPDGLSMPSYNDVGKRIMKWAEELEEEEEFGLAIRVYKQIDRFGLWEEDYENPKRRIKLLEYAQNGGQTELRPVADEPRQSDAAATPAQKAGAKSAVADDDWF